MTENQFREFFEHGVITHIRLVHAPGVGTVVEYTLQGGAVAILNTKRGAPKVYRTDTALAYLKSIGVGQVCIDFSRWDPDQAELHFGLVGASS